jgi:hypothetical protein
MQHLQRSGEIELRQIGEDDKARGELAHSHISCAKMMGW